MPSLIDILADSDGPRFRFVSRCVCHRQWLALTRLEFEPPKDRISSNLRYSYTNVA